MSPVASEDEGPRRSREMRERNERTMKCDRIEEENRDSSQVICHQKIPSQKSIQRR